MQLNESSLNNYKPNTNHVNKAWIARKNKQLMFVHLQKKCIFKQ